MMKSKHSRRIVLIDLQRQNNRNPFRVARRIAAIESGAIRFEPWADVKRRIERDVLGR
jgi:hypothetical protein